jgi:hypothetical protein
MRSASAAARGQDPEDVESRVVGEEEGSGGVKDGEERQQRHIALAAHAHCFASAMCMVSRIELSSNSAERLCSITQPELLASMETAEDDLRLALKEAQLLQATREREQHERGGRENVERNEEKAVSGDGWLGVGIDGRECGSDVESHHQTCEGMCMILGGKMAELNEELLARIVSERESEEGGEIKEEQGEQGVTSKLVTRKKIFSKVRSCWLSSITGGAILDMHSASGPRLSNLRPLR